MCNKFITFSDLPFELQSEAIREGELRIKAQLEVATAADARALSWGRLLTAAATGAIGAGIALLSLDSPDYLLALLALLFAAALITASNQALSTVEPKGFHLPGNNPSHWLPSEWQCFGSNRKKAKIARREQAEALAQSISENAAQAASRSVRMRTSFQIARISIISVSIVLCTILFARSINLDALYALLRCVESKP